MAAQAKKPEPAKKLKSHIRAATKCRDARMGLVWYRAATHHWQKQRLAEKLAGPGPRARGHSCGFVRVAAQEWKGRAAAARKQFYRWRESFSYRGGNPNVVLGQHMATAYGWHVGYEWEALYDLWNHESGWNHRAYNPSGACGIPQDMGDCHGYDPAAQIAWGLRYIRDTYGTPSNALSHFYSANWY